VIWDFFKQFGELIKLNHKFRLEELEAALSWQGGETETMGLIQSVMKQGVMALTEDLRERHYAHLKADPNGQNPEKSEV
jgi:DDT domain